MKTAVAIAAAAVVGILLGIGVHSLTNGGGSVGSRPAAEVRPAAGVRGQAVWPAGPRRAPDFSLPDSQGHRFSLASVRGEPAVIAFVDSHCHEVCPPEGRTLAAGIRRFGLAGFRWRWLLGSRAQLEGVWRRYGIEVKRTTGDIAHTDALYLVDSKGFERAGMVYPFLPTWISTDLKLPAGESR